MLDWASLSSSLSRCGPTPLAVVSSADVNIGTWLSAARGLRPETLAFVPLCGLMYAQCEPSRMTTPFIVTMKTSRAAVRVITGANENAAKRRCAPLRPILVFASRLRLVTRDGGLLSLTARDLHPPVSELHHPCTSRVYIGLGPRGR